MPPTPNLTVCFGDPVAMNHPMLPFGKFSLPSEWVRDLMGDLVSRITKRLRELGVQ